jgi:hypothetical protein
MGILSRIGRGLGFGEGYDEAARGAERAGTEYGNLGREQRDYYERATNQAQGYYGRAGGAYDQFYGAGGAGAGPSFSEDYYKSMSGKDPFAFERGQSARNVNAQAAAGGYGGKALAAHALGQSAFDDRLMQYRGQLAGQADQARTARFGQQMGAAMGLGGAQSGLQMQGAGMAGGAYGNAMEGGINARTNAAQLRGQGTNAAFGGMLDLGKTALSAGLGFAGGYAGGGGMAGGLKGMMGGGGGGGAGGNQYSMNIGARPQLQQPQMQYQPGSMMGGGGYGYDPYGGGGGGGYGGMQYRPGMMQF